MNMTRSVSRPDIVWRASNPVLSNDDDRTRIAGGPAVRDGLRV
jgi:hypothetical protein